jgi:hypothetical protein
VCSIALSCPANPMGTVATVPRSIERTRSVIMELISLLIVA